MLICNEIYVCSTVRNQNNIYWAATSFQFAKPPDFYCFTMIFNLAFLFVLCIILQIKLMAQIVEWKRGDAVLAAPKGQHEQHGTFSSEQFEARVLKVHISGSRRRRLVYLDLRFSNNGTKEYRTPLHCKNNIVLVRHDDDPSRGETDWETDGDEEDEDTHEPTPVVNVRINMYVCRRV